MGMNDILLSKNDKIFFISYYLLLMLLKIWIDDE